MGNTFRFLTRRVCLIPAIALLAGCEIPYVKTVRIGPQATVVQVRAVAGAPFLIGPELFWPAPYVTEYVKQQTLRVTGMPAIPIGQYGQVTPSPDGRYLLIEDGLNKYPWKVVNVHARKIIAVTQPDNTPADHYWVYQLRFVRWTGDSNTIEAQILGTFIDPATKQFVEYRELWHVAALTGATTRVGRQEREFIESQVGRWE